jgi:hypothetical protein
LVLQAGDCEGVKSVDTASVPSSDSAPHTDLKLPEPKMMPSDFSAIMRMFARMNLGNRSSSQQRQSSFGSNSSSMTYSTRHTHPLLPCDDGRKRRARCDVCSKSGDCIQHCPLCDWNVCYACLSSDKKASTTAEQLSEPVKAMTEFLNVLLSVAYSANFDVSFLTECVLKACKSMGSLEASANKSFLFNRSQCDKEIKISDDFTTATNSSNSKRMVLGTRGFSRGVHYWEVKINTLGQLDSGNIFVGVALADSSRWDGIGFVDCQKTQRYGGNQHYGTRVKPGDIIGVLLNMDHGTLSFIKVYCFCIYILSYCIFILLITGWIRV